MERVDDGVSISGHDSDAEDASPVLSDYSSCGESEFERYCSANSVLGSASVCSSVGNHNDFLDAFGSLVGGDDLGTLGGRERFVRSNSRNGDIGNSDRFDCLPDKVADFPRENGSHEDQVVWGRSDSLPRNRTGSKSFMGSGWNHGRKMVSADTENMVKVSSLSTRRNSAPEGGEEEMLGLGTVDVGRIALWQSENLQTRTCEDMEGIDLDSLPQMHFDTSVIQGISQERDVKDMSSYTCQTLVHDSTRNAKGCHNMDSLEVEEECTPALKSVATLNLTEHRDIADSKENLGDPAGKKGVQLVSSSKIADFHVDGVRGESESQSIPLIDSRTITSTEEFQPNESEPHEELRSAAAPSIENAASDEVEKLSADDFFNEMFLDMEEILLDPGESHLARYGPSKHGSTLERSHHFRDGSSTASTSHTDNVYPLIHYPANIDRVEVIGTRRKKGDVSFGERLIGVKEYTVYKLRVQGCNDQWEVERRYRDFFSLYRQLKTLFASHGLPLPPPWFKVEHESRKFFGITSPNITKERSTLIQDCLSSILNCRKPSGVLSYLAWFLSPSKDLCNSSLLNVLVPESLQRLRDDVISNSSYNGGMPEDFPPLGRTISLVIEVIPRKPKRQLLEEQHYTCAGCHRFLEAESTLMKEFVQTLGWGKPRVCEYTGELFCASCHTGDTAVLPARVLHQWDFSLFPVSQLAKAFLDSIYDQPMLCVSAVNPFLFSKVPALLHVRDIRRKIQSMLPYVRCPFRKSVERGLGSRRYLLESNDFFALRDLVDLSKGAFAALPTMIETVSDKIIDHIMQQCLVCYDVGVPCAARQACKATSSLIFPFQEAEAVKCASCGVIFHDICIEYLGGCPCSKLTRVNPAGPLDGGGDIELDGVVDSQNWKPDAKPSAGFISELLSKVRPDKLWKPRNGSPVILMGSLPSTSSSS